MKKLRFILPLLMLCMMLSGCQFILPYFYMAFTDHSGPTEPAELPVSADIDGTLSAENIYWRSKLAFSGKALQYSEITTVNLHYDFQDFSASTDLHYDTHVTLDPDTSSVNVQTLLAYDQEQPEEFWDYYRDENGELVYYYHEAETGYSSREVIEIGDATPYTIILNFTVYGFPYDPQDLQVEPQTRMLNDREVYVLTFTHSALNIFGYSGNTYRDDQLRQRMIPMTWYVDTQTYMPVQLDYTIWQMDDLLGSMVDAIYGVVEEGVTISGYSYSLQNLEFEPVEVSPIPDDVLQKAWENAGFSAS